MKREIILKILSDVTGETVEELERARNVQIIRPSEAIEAIDEVIKAYEPESKSSNQNDDCSYRSFLVCKNRLYPKRICGFLERNELCAVFAPMPIKKEAEVLETEETIDTKETDNSGIK